MPRSAHTLVCSSGGYCQTCDDIAQRRERVAQLTRAGFSNRQIAQDLKVTERTVQRDRVALGISKPGPDYYTLQEHERALQMLEDGAPYSEVARTIGRNVHGVSDRYQGLSRAVGGDIGRMNPLRRKLGLL